MLSLHGLRKSSVRPIKVLFNIYARFSSFTDHTPFDSTTNSYDIIISGAGIVGNTAACALGSSPSLKRLRVLVLDGGPRFQDKITPHYSNRVFSLTHGTQQYLKKLDIWPNIVRIRAKPIEKFQIWEDLPDSGLVFTNEQGGTMSHIVENQVILKALEEKLKTLSRQVHVRDNTTVTSYRFPSKHKMDTESHIQVHLNDGTTLTTKLLIGADGYNSLVRRSLEFPYKTWDYKQRAIVATIAHRKISNNVAFQRFLKTGPIALLPLNDSTSSLVWSLPTTIAERLMAMSDKEFDETLQSAFGSAWAKYSNEPRALGEIQNSIDWKTPLGPLMVMPQSRATFPLHFGHSSHYVACRTALVGDSAHRIHPMAGQGLNLGFGDIQSLVTNLEKNFELGQDIGDISSLLDYESERQKYVIPMMLAIDGINNLFSNTFFPLLACRRVGFSVLDNLDLVKKLLVKFYQQ